ncbi:MAG: T9SS type A sorting domain-containing protein [Saprospiraceae bacterium]|nr:T9SS type A sorting domain-containing protein [Saprospiraceae bacterium]
MSIRRTVVNLLIIYVVTTLPAWSQKYDNTWILGIDYNSSKEDGYDDAAEGMILRFDQSPPSIEKYPIPMKMVDFSIMSHPETGDMLFYTNGCRIMDKNHQIMENGDSINPGDQFRYYCNEGASSFYSNFNGNLALPMPGASNKDKYILFTRPKRLVLPSMQKILFHEINMAGNGGSGIVIKKNVEIFLSNSLALMSLQACKHKNGHDWWILFWERDKPVYHVILLDKNGPRHNYTDTIGTIGPYGINQACFSPYGSQYIWFDHTRGVALYDFDRQTGKLENFRTKVISPYYEYGFGGVSFSPSGRFAYLSASYELFQLDTWEPDFDKAFTLIDTISTITPVGIPLDFANSMLAPDCKIYISTGFTWFYYHVIHNPDEKGKACDLRKLDLQLPWPNSNSAVPNNVHYRMDEEEVCNPRLTSLFPEEWYGSNGVKLYPNPTSDKLTIEGIEKGLAHICNVSGKVVAVYQIAGTTEIDVTSFVSGVYIIRFENGANQPILKRWVKI